MTELCGGLKRDYQKNVVRAKNNTLKGIWAILKYGYVERL